MNIIYLYPKGKTKAVTFSYDDGQIFDKRLVGIFNQYGLKGTFNLNSGIIGKKGYVNSNEIKNLYIGHEIACHGVEHNYLTHLTKEQLVKEIWDDRRRLEQLAGQLVLGMAYPFGEYSNECIKTLQCLGIKYARTVENTNSFCIPNDFMTWKPTCHHNDSLLEKAENFLRIPEYMKLPLLYVWGHSFEFERENNWEIIENFCERIGLKEDVWYATNIEIREYICAMKSLIFNVDETICYNPSGCAVWLKKKETIVIKPGETIML